MISAVAAFIDAVFGSTITLVLQTRPASITNTGTAITSTGATAAPSPPIRQPDRGDFDRGRRLDLDCTADDGGADFGGARCVGGGYAAQSV